MRPFSLLALPFALIPALAAPLAAQVAPPATADAQLIAPGGTLAKTAPELRALFADMGVYAIFEVMSGLARETGARLHLMRLSSAAGVAMVREARANGLKVSCDIDIHHLHLSEADIGFFDSHARFDPPLRSAEDREALCAAAAEGLAAILRYAV